MNEPLYTVEELKQLFKTSPYSSKHTLNFIKWLSSLQEQPEQKDCNHCDGKGNAYDMRSVYLCPHCKGKQPPVDRKSEQTRQTGTPPKIEPLTQNVLEITWVKADGHEKLQPVAGIQSISVMRDTVNQLISVVNQLASKKE